MDDMDLIYIWIVFVPRRRGVASGCDTHLHAVRWP